MKIYTLLRAIMKSSVTIKIGIAIHRRKALIVTTVILATSVMVRLSRVDSPNLAKSCGEREFAFVKQAFLTEQVKPAVALELK